MKSTIVAIQIYAVELMTLLLQGAKDIGGQYFSFQLYILRANFTVYMLNVRIFQRREGGRC